MSSVVDELLPFDRLNINDFFHSEPKLTNLSMEFHVTNSYNIFGNGMVMDIKFFHNGSRYTRALIA